ncbi:MAG: PKD domain-containing protein [Bacteroidales bacterium]|nr:PKD domain-containing protein [Bacteroidales bacterium]
MKKNILTPLSIILLVFFIINSCDKTEDKPQPTACFNASKTQASISDTIIFTNCSQNADSYLWKFGDGSQSTDVNPTHSYSSAGTFVVNLLAGNGDKNAQTNVTIIISEDTVTACFTVSTNTANTGESITFANCSENATSYSWAFGDGATSTDTSPSHSYTSAGNYTVTLTASDGNDTDQTTEIITITQPVVVTACFTVSTTTANIEESITFTNCSQNATSYSWTFGDGATSTDTSLSHSYSSAGTYTVTLTASDGSNTDQATETITITEASSAFIDESFETYEDFSLDFGSWEQVDIDLSSTWGITGYEYPNAGYVGAFMIFNPSATNPAITYDNWQSHTGNKYAACFSATNPPNNDVLISKELTLSDNYTFSFWVKSVTDEYGLERFFVTLLDVNTETFYWLTPEGYYLEAPVSWTQCSFDLSEYSGKEVTLNIHCISDDAFVFMVDDVLLNNSKNNSKAGKFNVKPIESINHTELLKSLKENPHSNIKYKKPEEFKTKSFNK